MRQRGLTGSGIDFWNLQTHPQWHFPQGLLILNKQFHHLEAKYPKTCAYKGPFSFILAHGFRGFGCSFDHFAFWPMARKSIMTWNMWQKCSFPVTDWEEGEKRGTQRRERSRLFIYLKHTYPGTQPPHKGGCTTTL